jgi:SAM-dependent methyltransferase
MTAPLHPDAVRTGLAAAPLPPPVPGDDLVAWNRTLNRSHAMASLRARGGRLVRAIEARRRRLVASRVRRGRHHTVVDVGCEDGWVARAYADDVDTLVLVDLDGDVLRASPLARRPGVTTAAADATDPGSLARVLPRGHADVVVLSALLEHLPEPGRALAALSPFLARGGRFVVFVPADGPILLAKAILRRTGLGHLVRGLSLDPAPGHLHRFDRSRLARLLRRHGHVEELSFDPAVLGYVAVLRPFSAASHPTPGRGP